MLHGLLRREISALSCMLPAYLTGSAAGGTTTVIEPSVTEFMPILDHVLMPSAVSSVSIFTKTCEPLEVEARLNTI
jgi:hypothetical protein